MYSVRSYLSFYKISSKEKLENWQRHYNSRGYDIQKVAINFIQKNSNTGDSLYIYGDAFELYALTNRRSSTKHVTFFNITNKEWDEINKQVITDEPKIIMIDQNRRYAVYPQIQKLLSEKYTLILDEENFKYYKLK